MDPRLETLLIRLGYDLKEFKNSSNQVDDLIGKTVNKATTGFKQLFGFVATGYSLKLLAGMINDFGEAGRRIDFLSTRVGIGTQGLQLFEQAAKRTGSSVQGLDNSLESIFMRLQNAQKGQDNGLFPLLQSLGVNPRNAIGGIKTPIQLLTDIGQAENQQKARTDLPFINSQLGIDPGVARLFSKDPKELQDLLGRVQNNGILSDQDVKNAKDSADALDDFSQALSNFKNSLITLITPVIKVIGNDLNDVSKTFNSVKSGVTTGDWSELSDMHKRNMSILNHDMKVLVNSPDLPKGSKFINPFTPFNQTVDTFSSPLDPLSSFYNTNKSSTNKDVLNAVPELKQYLQYRPSQNPNITRAQALKESTNNPNAIGGQNEKEPTYGLYQIRLSTARDVAQELGIKDTITPKMLMNPEFNKQIRDRYLDDFTDKAYNAGLKDPQDINKASLAGYNGGQSGFDNFIKTHRSFNNYAESILSPEYNASSISQPMTDNSSTKTSSTTINIQSMNLTGVNNPDQFINQINSKLQSAYSFQSNELA